MRLTANEVTLKGVRRFKSSRLRSKTKSPDISGLFAFLAVANLPGQREQVDDQPDTQEAEGEQPNQPFKDSAAVEVLDSADSNERKQHEGVCNANAFT